MNKLHDLSGEKKNQMLVVVDQSGRKLGLDTRENCHKGKGITHLAFIALLKDKNDKIILTRRSKSKSLWALFWDGAIVSHILPGETAEQAASRRGRQELGVDVKFRDLGAFYYQAAHGESSENEYCHFLVGQTRESVRPNPVEIDDVKFLSLKELLEDLKINSDKYTPWFKLAMAKFKINGY